MVNFCAVIGCGNRWNRDKGKSFYRLPAIITSQGVQTQTLSEKRRVGWLAAIRRKDIKKESYPFIRVCSDHFKSGKPATLYDTTSPDWIPTLNLGHNELKEGDTSRHDRATERATKRRKLSEEQAIVEEERAKEEDEEERRQQEKEQEKIGEIKRLHHELETTQDQLDMVTKELEKTHEELYASRLDEDGFKDNHEKVCYYTGLPKWGLLYVMFTFLKPHLSTASRKALTPFQQVLMTMMRLRLNLSGQDLAYRFSVHNSTISRTFINVIDIMYARLKPLILWPDRDILRQTMPMDFRKHCPTCAVIIDCFEIFIERPSNVLARAQTFSSYKHHNTVKYSHHREQYALYRMAGIVKIQKWMKISI